MAFIGAKPTNVPLTSADIQDGTVALADLSATGTKDATTFLRGDNTFAEAGGGVNTPYFYATLSSNQTLSNDTNTKIAFNTASIDSDSAFDGTTFTVPSNKAGRYYIHANIASDFSDIGSDGERALLYIYKNGSGLGIFNDFFINSGYNVLQISNAYSAIIDLSAGDTIELYIYNKDGNASGNAKVSGSSHWFGYKLA